MPELPFQPRRWLSGGHVQTIASSLWPTSPVCGPATALVARVCDDASVRLDTHRAVGARGTLLLIHGMCGSSESSYMRRCANLALGRRWSVARMNLRNCGGTESLSRTLYNAGQSDDIGPVLEMLEHQRMPRPFVAAGFSLGGNILLRYAGQAGGTSGLDAAAAVNPPIDLDSCARAIERAANRIYQAYYVHRLCRQLRRIRRNRTVVGPPARPRSIRSVRGFDARFTAPDAGYASAEAYYADASAGPFLSGVHVPSCIISARNDPFVPVADFDPHHALPGLRFVHPDDGGHCGYWQAGDERSWAAETMLDFFEETLRRRGRAQA